MMLLSASDVMMCPFASDVVMFSSALDVMFLSASDVIFLSEAYACQSLM